MFNNGKNFFQVNKSFLKNFNKISKKSFSNRNGMSSGGSALKYATLAFAVGGLGFLTMDNMRGRAQHSKALLAEQSYEQKIVSERVRNTFVYFCTGLGLTAGLTTVMARTSIITYAMSPWSLLLSLPVSFFSIYKMRSTSPTDSMKPAYFLLFNSAMSFNLSPLAAYIPAIVFRDAGFLTAGLCSGLGLVAVTSKDDAFIGASGALGAGLGVITALSIANLFMQSPIIHNIWLYGGLALFTGFLMYDVKQVQIRAQKSEHFDAMAESIHIYMDTIQIFVRLAMILNSRKK
jgi:FtsH-binding integral membrane protein